MKQLSVRKKKVTFDCSPLTWDKINKLRKQQGYFDKPFEEWLKYLTRDTTTGTLPSEQIEKSMREGGMLDLWMNNFAMNFPYIKWGDGVQLQTPENSEPHSISALATPMPILEGEAGYAEAKDAPVDNRYGTNCKYPPQSAALVIGRGPSVFKNKHLEMLADAIAKKEFKGKIIIPDGILIDCLSHNIIPDYTITVDGSPIIEKWYNHPLVAKYGPKLKTILAVTIHHETYKLIVKNGLKVYWYEPLWDDWRQNESFTRMQRLMTKSKRDPNGIPAASSGGNSGACAFAMASAVLKCAPVGLVGMDYGYPEGTKIGETPYYSSYMTMSGGNLDAIAYNYQEVYHPFFKTKATIDHVFANYRRAFLSMQKASKPWYLLYGGTINCTEGGTIYGEGINCMYFKTFLEKYGKYEGSK
jgi:hypothetical protein